MFITFEGPEGGGKTTQTALLRRRLEAAGATVCVTRQPGGEALGKRLRALLLDPLEASVEPVAELLMMMADRAQSVARVIEPALRSGDTVICDRYADSSVAYQGYGRGIAHETVDVLNSIATGGLMPDLTFLLDIDPSAGLQRQSDRNRMESESMEFHRRVRAGYLEMARDHPQRIRVVDASRSIEDIAEEISRLYEAHRCHRP